jgi:aspartate racemase
MTDALQDDTPLIGILGGMGPSAGLDLANKILLETVAELDQQHVGVIHLSIPAQIPNRTHFLLGKTDTNPAIEISRQLEMLDSLGVSVAAIACNTAHASPIFDKILAHRDTAALRVKLLNMIDETVRFIRQHLPEVRKVGILGTLGTIRFKIYEDRLTEAGLTASLPDSDIAEGILDEAIFHPVWGIKATSNPVTSQARDRVLQAIEHVRDKGAEIVILGCTELPLAVDDSACERNVIVDPARILARALVRQAVPDRLRPLS